LIENLRQISERFASDCFAAIDSTILPLAFVRVNSPLTKACSIFYSCFLASMKSQNLG